MPADRRSVTLRNEIRFMFNREQFPGALVLYGSRVASPNAASRARTEILAPDILKNGHAVNPLVQGDDLFRELADTMPQLVWMADSKGEILWYNRRWYEYTGTTFDEMKGRGWKPIHDPRFCRR
jgi:PAS domain-containing protein